MHWRSQHQRTVRSQQAATLGEIGVDIWNVLNRLRRQDGIYAPVGQRNRLARDEFQIEFDSSSSCHVSANIAFNAWREQGSIRLAPTTIIEQRSLYGLDRVFTHPAVDDAQDQ